MSNPLMAMEILSPKSNRRVRLESMAEVCVSSPQALACHANRVIGGVQNIGKKEKEAKKDKGKAKDGESTPVGQESAKKEKKSVGIRGIRGFV